MFQSPQKFNICLWYIASPPVRWHEGFVPIHQAQADISARKNKENCPFCEHETLTASYAAFPRAPQRVQFYTYSTGYTARVGSGQ